MDPAATYEEATARLTAPGAPFEVVTEVVREDDEWLLGSPRALDAASPLGRPIPRPVTAWLEAPSARAMGGGPLD